MNRTELRDRQREYAHEKHGFVREPVGTTYVVDRHGTWRRTSPKVRGKAARRADKAKRRRHAAQREVRHAEVAPGAVDAGSPRLVTPPRNFSPPSMGGR